MTSSPRTSPTTSRSGRIRRACRTSTRIGTSPGALDVGGPGLEPDDVRVVGPQLAGVLDDHHPVAGVDQGQQGGEQGGLPRAGAAADQEGEPGAHQPPQQGGGVGVDRAVVLQLGDGEHPAARHPQRDHGARPGERGQHGVEAGAVGEAQVDVGRRVVEPPPHGPGEPLRQPAHRGVVGEPGAR